MAVRPAIVRSSKGVGRTTSFTQLPAVATTITSAAMARSSARWSANDYLERHWNACAPQLSDSVYRLHHIELREVDYASIAPMGSVRRFGFGAAPTTSSVYGLTATPAVPNRARGSDFVPIALSLPNNNRIIDF